MDISRKTAGPVTRAGMIAAETLIGSEIGPQGWPAGEIAPRLN
jgi:hypothetical protein